MNKSREITSALENVPFNKLIFASQFYQKNFLNTVSADSFFKTLERLCKAGKLCRISKGTYCRPKIGKYGAIPPSAREITEDFTKDRTGTVVGYNLYNRLGLTTQVSKRIDVLSSQINQRTKSIGDVHITQIKIEFSKNNKIAIHMLEVLKDFDTIQDINYAAFERYCQKFSLQYCDEATQYVLKNIKYQKRTISFLHEILSFYHIPNTLSAHLSVLSDYKHPSMEAIYEAAYAS